MASVANHGKSIYSPNFQKLEVPGNFNLKQTYFIT